MARARGALLSSSQEDPESLEMDAEGPLTRSAQQKSSCQILQKLRVSYQTCQVDMLVTPRMVVYSAGA